MFLELVRKLEAFCLQGPRVIDLQVIQVVIETTQILSELTELTVKLEAAGERWNGGEAGRERKRENTSPLKPACA